MGGIIFLDDAGGKYIDHKDIYLAISRKCPNSIFICWYWSTQPYFQPFKKMIFTGEYNLNNDSIDEVRRQYFHLPNFVPLRLRADDPPCVIGKYPRNVVRDYCFMGTPYRKDWVPQGFTGIYHDLHQSPYLSYDERRQIYLSSTFTFAFQSDDNILNGHLSQRIFEGLAYGCIVLCENKLASAVTDGIVVYISSKEDLIEKMNYFKERPESIAKKQNKGYEWVKKYGTNRYATKFFLEKIKELYGEGFCIP